MATGYALGGIGAWLLPGRAAPIGVLILLGMALLAVARELGWVQLPLPQPRRQTKDLWARAFSPHVAATLWGLDLGLAVTTRFTFSGTWVLVLLPVLTGTPGLGASVLLVYWLGRAAPVWIAPLLMRDASSVPRLLDAISSRFRLLQLVHVFGLGLLIAFLAVSEIKWSV